MKFLLTAAIAIFVANAAPSLPSKEAGPKLVSYPLAIDPACRNGMAKSFDECSDQLELFQTAFDRAQTDGKSLLVSFGAEWCIWCHVFDAHLKGDFGRFRYTFGSPEATEERYRAVLYEKAGRDVTAEAAALAQYVADNFVVVHIEHHYAEGGQHVLERTGADEHFMWSYPFNYVVNAEGTYVGEINHDDVEVRRDKDYDWYRGYDRRKMLDILKSLRAKSQKGVPEAGSQ